jgi:hypothetical protein
MLYATPRPAFLAGVKGLQLPQLDLDFVAKLNRCLWEYDKNPNCACIAKLLQSAGFTKVAPHNLDGALLHLKNITAGHHTWSAEAAAAFVDAVITYSAAAAATATAATAEEEGLRDSVQQLLCDAPDWWDSNELIAAGAVLAAGGPLLTVHEMQRVMDSVSMLRDACGENHVMLYKALPALAASLRL